jgi:3'(2'), 5'-bisphosphate nucleotidase
MVALNLDDLIALALAAGREIMAVRAAGFEAMTKGDGSIVTIADQRAEAIIERGLKELAPNVPMIGEEAVAEGRIPECGDAFFCVDPLDGTRGFAKGGDQFTVNIALIEAGVPTVGVVFAPANGELYAGEPGRAVSALYDANTGMLSPLAPIAAQKTQPPQWRIIASETSGRDATTTAFVQKLNGAPAHASSSIKFCRLAEGKADLYPRFGEVSEWDVAAAHAVLRAAGGEIMRLDAQPLRYGDAAGRFIVKGFVAYASEAAKAAALSAMPR